MKARLITVIALVCTSWTIAAAGLVNNSFRYEKHHYLYQKGDEINVIDVDLEWPEIIDGSERLQLQSYLCDSLFRVSASDIDKGMELFLQRFGSPVTQQFKTIPDDNKFCYIDAKLERMGYEKGRFASFRLTYHCAPESLSTVPSDSMNILITYDIMHDKVLEMDGLLNMSRVRNGWLTREVYSGLARQIGWDAVYNAEGFMLNDACMLDSRMLFDLTYIGEGEMLPFSLTSPVNNIRNVLNKEFRKTLDNKLPASMSMFIPEDSMYQGEPVYENALGALDSLAEFKGGNDSLMQYMKDNVKFANGSSYKQVEGKVIASFIIDKNGEPKNVRITNPVSVSLDREVVRLIRLMPKWKPGVRQGKKVNVRYVFPVYFKPN